jgi:hypothetical protein
MPRFVLGPRVGIMTFPVPDGAPTDPSAPTSDQSIDFKGINGDRQAVYELGELKPGVVPIKAVHLVFVRPPVPEGADAAYFLGAEFETTRYAVFGPFGREPVTVPIPAEAIAKGGTWDGQTVLEYPDAPTPAETPAS